MVKYYVYSKIINSFISVFHPFVNICLNSDKFKNIQFIIIQFIIIQFIVIQFRGVL